MNVSLVTCFVTSSWFQHSTTNFDLALVSCSNLEPSHLLMVEVSLGYLFYRSYRSLNNKDIATEVSRNEEHLGSTRQPLMEPPKIDWP